MGQRRGQPDRSDRSGLIDGKLRRRDSDSTKTQIDDFGSTNSESIRDRESANQLGDSLER